MAGFVDEHRELISEEVRAAEFTDSPSENADRLEAWEIEDTEVEIGVSVVAEQTA